MRKIKQYVVLKGTIGGQSLANEKNPLLTAKLNFKF